MTIKQQGGIFGRNPTFNDVEVEGDISVGGDLFVDNDIGVGTNSPEAKIDVFAGSLGTTAGNNLELLELSSTNTNASRLRFFEERTSSGSDWSTSAWKIQRKVDSSQMGFVEFSSIGVSIGAGIPGSTVATFKSTGLAFPDGNGIDFSATSGTGTSELFDDYEEGTFTPNLLFGGANTGMTYTNQDGVYTKVGNVVHFQIYIRLSAKGSSTGNTSITGLPFATDFGYNIPAIWWTNMATGLQPFSFATNGSTTLIVQANVSGSSQNITNTSFNDTSRIAVSATFRV